MADTENTASRNLNGVSDAAWEVGRAIRNYELGPDYWNSNALIKQIRESDAATEEDFIEFAEIIDTLESYSPGALKEIFDALVESGLPFVKEAIELMEADRRREEEIQRENIDVGESIGVDRDMVSALAATASDMGLDPELLGEDFFSALLKSDESTSKP